MFILRKITGEGLEMNFALGNAYNLVTKEHNPEEFRKCTVVYNDKEEAKNHDLYGYVICWNGKDVYRLYPKQQNYIMTESGATFSNLSLKQ